MSKLTKEQRDELLEKRRQIYYSLDDEIDRIRHKLQDLKQFGTSNEARNFKLAADIMSNKIRRDMNRFNAVVTNEAYREECALLQKSLNRANKKNLELESKIEEAKSSSGLFIDFCEKIFKNKLK